VKQWQTLGTETDVEMYRANHYGSGYSSIPMLINALDPEFVIYSCGGMYKHPAHDVVSRCALTARQCVTTRLDKSAWSSIQDFEALRGTVVGNDIDIQVGRNGLWYAINGELHRAYTDQDEDGNSHPPQGSGLDVGEEDRYW
jgi:hypothetical protein